MLLPAKLKLCALAAVLMSIFTWLAPNASAAEPKYKVVYGGDIIMGHVPVGQLIETKGYLWFSTSGVFLNVNRPSAHVPLIVHVGRLPAEQKVKAQSACTAAGAGHEGGCEVTIRGRTAMIGNRRAIMAEDIDLRTVHEH